MKASHSARLFARPLPKPVPPGLLKAQLHEYHLRGACQVIVDEDCPRVERSHEGSILVLLRCRDLAFHYGGSGVAGIPDKGFVAIVGHNDVPFEEDNSLV